MLYAQTQEKEKKETIFSSDSVFIFVLVLLMFPIFNILIKKQYSVPLDGNIVSISLSAVHCRFPA